MVVLLKPHERADLVCWAVHGGRRAVFAAFGLGKTMIQLETIRLIFMNMSAGRGLIPRCSGVRQEFFVDAKKSGSRLSLSG